METAPIAPELRLLAPRIGATAGHILRNLIVVIVYVLRRNPRLAPRIGPLCGYIHRTIRRFERLMARVSAGTQPKQTQPKPSSPSPSSSRGGHKPTNLPTSHLWLIRAIPYHAAGFASQLQHLLTQPGAAELIAQTPAAGRILRPLARLLGITLPGDLPIPTKTIRIPQSKRPHAPSRPPPQPAPDPGLPTWALNLNFEA